MPTPAVTEAAPAVADFQNSEDSTSNFLPTDEKYRLTGEMPSEPERDPRQIREENREQSARKEKPSVKESDSAAPDEKAPSEKEGESATSGTAETAADSASAKPQKTKTSSESRWQKITRENRELREKLRQKQSISTQEQARDTQQASQPATTDATKPKAVPKPKIDDVDPKTQQPKYKSYAEYEEAKDQWLLEEGARKAQETSVKFQRDREQSEAEQIIGKTIDERATKARETYPDYDTAMTEVIGKKDQFGQDEFFFAPKSPLDGFFLDCERSHDLYYHLAKNWDASKHIFARDARGNYLLNPIRQIRELAKIESQLPARTGRASTENSSARSITQASRPPHQVSGTGTVAKDAVEQALEDGDFETYQRAQNAKELARLKKK